MSHRNESELAQETTVLADGVLAGNRRALAQAITLIESTRLDHRAAASALLQRLTPHAGKSIRLRHLSQDCYRLLSRSGLLFDESDDDPDYQVATDYSVRVGLFEGAH